MSSSTQSSPSHKSGTAPQPSLRPGAAQQAAQYLSHLQQTFLHLARTPGMVAALLCALVFAALAALGTPPASTALATLPGAAALRSLDDAVRGQLLRSTPAGAATRTPQVLLVQADPAQIGNQAIDWPRLIAPWLDNGALRVGLNLPLNAEQISSLQALIDSGQVVLAQSGAADQAVGAAYWQQLGANLQQAAAPAASWPDYSFPLAALPAVSLHSAQQEGLLPALYKHKIILLGYAPAPQLRSYHLPGQVQEASQLQRDALEVDARLNHAQIMALPTAPWLMIILSLALALLWRHSGLRFGLLTLFASLLLSAVASWCLLAAARLWLPLPLLCLNLITVFAVVCYARLHGAERQMRALISSTSGKLQKMALPPSIFQTQDHWQFILRLIDQTLHANRVIILEKIPGQYHLREVQNLGQTPHAIRELRRDYRRAPYAQAIAQRGLVEVASFLSLRDESEQQFVMPLLMHGEVLGFLALGVQVRECKAFYRQQGALAPIAQQIARLLSQRQSRLNEESRQHSLLPLPENERAMQQLKQALGLMEQRLAIVEQTFAQAGQAAIVYDLFGRVLLVNSQMNRRLSNKAAALHSLSASDFIARLSGKSLEQTRLAMQGLILHHTSFIWPVNLAELAEEHLVLRASALANEGQADSGELQPFRLGGVLVEVMDVGQLMLRHDAHAEIRLQAAHYLHEDLHSLPALLRALQHDKIQPGMQQKILAALEKKAASIQAIMEKSRLLLEDQSQQQNQALCYPLDACALLEKTVAEHAALLSPKNLQIKASLAGASAHGFAVAKELKFCYLAVLQLLIHDAGNDSQISITVSENAQYLTLHFANQGYGIANARLQKSLSEASSHAQSPLFAQAYAARRLIAGWGGKLAFQSAVGEGTRARLSLSPFWWRAHDNDALLLAQIAQARPAAGAAQPPPWTAV